MQNYSLCQLIFLFYLALCNYGLNVHRSVWLSLHTLALNTLKELKKILTKTRVSKYSDFGIDNGGPAGNQYFEWQCNIEDRFSNRKKILTIWSSTFLTIWVTIWAIPHYRLYCKNWNVGRSPHCEIYLCNNLLDRNDFDFALSFEILFSQPFWTPCRMFWCCRKFQNYLLFLYGVEGALADSQDVFNAMKKKECNYEGINGERILQYSC